MTMRIAGLVCSLAIGIGSVMMAAPAARANVAVGVAIRIGPPALPVYAQPLCPGPGYIWTPGYWAWGDAGYYWVPGTWVLPPEAGLLWTPGYWAFSDGVYVWNAGYWGPTVGFYGGIDYGFGYPGVGFFGGYWRGHNFYYNRAVTHVDAHVVRNVYDEHVAHHPTRFDRVSFNGGAHGVHARPTAREEAAMHEHHFRMTTEQSRHLDAARSDRALRASVNHGRPHIAATERAGEIRGRPAEHAARKSVRATNHPARTKAPAQQHPAATQRSAAAYERQQAQRRQAEVRTQQARARQQEAAQARQPRAQQRQQQQAQARQARAQQRQQQQAQARQARAQQHRARPRQQARRQAPQGRPHKPPLS